jgi:hypothetical protein
VTDRKLVIYAEVSLPPDMAEAGRIQIAWAEQVKKFNAGLPDGVGVLELRVASSRPRGTKTTEPKGPPLPAPVGQVETQANGAEAVTVPLGAGSPVTVLDDGQPAAKVPPWAQR